MRLLTHVLLAAFLAPTFSLTPVLASDSVITAADGSKLTVNLEGDLKSKDAQTFVLLNGLVYDLHRWDRVAAELVRKGHRVIRYAYAPQPANLRLLEKNEAPSFFKTGLTPQKMSEEVEHVLRAAQVSGKIQLVGLSYGASVAAAFAARNPDRISNLFFLAPLVVPTDSYDPRSAGLRLWLTQVRFWENSPCSVYGSFNPLLCSAQDYWYDSFYNSIYETYLTGKEMNVPAGVSPELYKKSLFHLIRAARDFDLKNAIRDFHNVSMFVASDDDQALRADQEKAWQALLRNEQRVHIEFLGAKHALPDEAPLRVVEFLEGVVQGKPELISGGRLEIRADQ